jgi:GR25 family glycosyltransferase involved in LPS biosynthesis
MAFINRVCDKVFVINLDKDKERLQNFDSIMNNNQIKYNRFKAVEGSKILHDDRLTEYCNTFCTDGMKGCALSHKSIWDLMIKNNYKNVLVFEDDAVIDDNFDRNFQDVWNHLPKDFDIIYFGCVLGCSDDSVSNSIFKKIMGYDNEEINEFVMTTKGSAGTHCYMISLEGAKKFSDKPINFHIDIQILNWIKTYNYKAYSTNINLAETSQNNSSISDTYPNLLNSLFKQFNLNNLKQPSTLDWALNENFLKIGIFNLNYLIIILMIIVLLIPQKFYIYLFTWLFIEFIISFDLKNTIRYFLFLSIPILIKYTIYRK